MGRYKKYLAILLMFSIHMMPFNLARATTVTAEGWTVQKRLVQGATTFYDGTKSVILNGKNYAATGTAAITPVAGQVAKMIVRTGAVIAVDLAVKALIGAVDYVMDPANSQVKYYVDPAGTQCSKSGTNCPGYYYLFYREPGTNGAYFSTVDPACTAIAAYYKQTLVSVDKYYQSGRLSGGMCHTKTATGANDQWAVSALRNPAYNPNAQPQKEEKYLPYETVASQIISDAVANKADGKAYVSTVADTALENEKDQIVPADQVIDQLNQTQAIPTSNTATGTATPSATTGTGTGTGTGDPTAQPAPSTDISLNFPVFCSWAPTVCQAAQTVISFPSTLQKWWDTGSKAASSTWTDIQEWVKDPENPDNTLDLDDQPQTEPNTQINFATSCPAKIPLNFSWNGQSLDFSFDFSIWCESISTFVYPIVVALGALHALYIVSGVREDG
ncbi:virulence factor TspB C-terminal domain-related protein [Acinetobacter nosocomialis]|uniref:virulence factor TspB C-terminal domain-related protein n=3 Tax=Acinetobacter nosocomialis TaxID=106654 RepID=UPI003F61DDA3